MGIQERKDREREQRKSMILDCAMKVFLKKGVVAANMEEIAECAEFSKATLYLYFKNKEEIILNVMNSIMHTLLGYLDEKIASVDSSEAKIGMIKEALVAFYRNNHAQYLLINSQEPTPDMDFSSFESYKELGAQNKRLWATICAPIYKAIEEGYFRKTAIAPEIAFSLYGATTGIMNIMDNVDISRNCEDFKKQKEKTDYQKQVCTLDTELMLKNVWDAIILSYRNNK